MYEFLSKKFVEVDDNHFLLIHQPYIMGNDLGPKIYTIAEE
jgi:hypothetical protein